jgi:hypothetical protein
VNPREDAVIGRVDNWLALEFAAHRMSETLRDLAEAEPEAPAPIADDDTADKIADCGRKLAQYRAASTQAPTRPPSPSGSPNRGREGELRTRNA